MKVNFSDIFLIFLLIVFFSLFFRLFHNFSIILLPKEHTYRKVNESYSNLKEYREEMGVNCYKNFDNKIYCIFPDNDERLFYTTGHSMLPFFQGDNEILLCNENFTLEEDGIYAYNYSEISDIPIVHRCIHKTSYGCIFKGDNNKGSENITNEQILCRINWLIRKIN